ncbi:GATA zinc finger-domain-containing protein, partial [Rhodotorula toruloides]
CTSCGTTQTPLWRRDPQGKTICNACGLYYKLHGGQHRPVNLKKPTIKRRKR